MIHYALENQRVAKEYLVNFTNAAFVIKEGFKLPDDGLYSGFDPATQTYDKSTWNYEEGGNLTGKASAADPPAAANAKPSRPAAPASLPPNVAYDTSLEHPRCVYQLLRKQYSRYTPEMVERITGIPKDQFLKAADLFTSIRKDGDTKKVATIIYAVGWTQHTFGSQIIRTAAMLQLLLGNVGRAGGGVNALRGHSNIQGATDIAGIFDNLPGYLKVPTPADNDFDGWMKRITPTSSKPKEWDSWNYWSNTRKFAVSFMKAMYGDAATKENGWAFDYLPKVDREYSWVHIWDDMYQGKVKGLIAFGMNGVAIGPNSQKNIDALKKADWLVVCEIYPDETSGFWRSPGITPDDMKNIKTEVYRLPGAGFAEKDGTFVNSARWLQWKWAALPPPGDAKARPGNPGAHFPQGPRAVSERRRQVPRPNRQSNLELHRSHQSFALRSRQRAEWPRDRRRHRPGHATGDQSRPAIAGLRLPSRRRLHFERQLALVRLLDRSRPADAAARHGRPVRPGHLSQLGLVLADEPPRDVQPRLLRREWQALGPGSPPGLVERSAKTLGRQRRARFQSRLPA